ncbi:MAG: efflux transporter outer membrane subunit [Pseudomonadota bacterium]
MSQLIKVPKMEIVQRYRLLGGLAVSFFAGGCALTPAPEAPDLVRDLGASEHFAQSDLTAAGLPETEDWWLALGGAELDGLVSTLLVDSLILQESRLQAVQAQEGTVLARAQRLPSIVAIGDASTSRSPDLLGDFSWSEAYSAGLLLDFNTDVFGGLRASQRAAELTAIATELSVEATEQREIALLARNWVSAITLQRRLELAERTAESFRSTYELTDQRYSAGSSSVSASDVQIALQNLETALVDIPQIETDLTKQFLVIDEQLGRLPGETAQTFVGSFAPFEAFTAPVGRPARLLASRPDVAAAELRYLAALEDVGSARASLYPAISLSTSLTFQGDTPGDVFDWDRHIASLAGSLTAPIFQGGRLKSQVRLEEAQATELATIFARTALGAVIDVELALADLAGLEEQRIQLEAALETAALSNELAQGRYRQGLNSILSVLETQRSLNAAEQNLLLIDQSLANARIDLFLSLGGNWSGEDAVSGVAETS